MTIAGWLSDILGLHPRADGVPRTPRRTVDFVGVDWADNPTTGIATWRIKVAEILDRLANATGPIDVNGQRIVDVGAPTTSTDAATKGYVDSAVVTASGTDVLTAKLAVRARMPAQLTIPSTLVTDGGVTAAVDDRILLDQLTDAAARGIYDVTPVGPWTRAADFNATADIADGALVLVVAGADAGKLYQLDQLGATLGATALSFSQAGGGGSVFASIEAQDYAEIGTNVDPVAASGYVRMPFAGPHVIVRNFGNSADLEVITTSGTGTNKLFFGDATVPAELTGTTTTITGSTEVETNCGIFDLNATSATIDTSSTCAIVAGGALTLSGTTVGIDGTGAMSLGTTNQTGLTAGRSASNTTINGNNTTINAAAAVTLAPTGALLINAGQYIQANISYGAFRPASRLVWIEESGSVQRFWFRIPADVAVSSATTTTVATFSPAARASTYRVVVHAYDASGNARTWSVEVDALLFGGAAVLSASPPSGAAATRTIGSPVAGTLTIDQSTTTIRVRYVSTDATALTVTCTVEEIL